MRTKISFFAMLAFAAVMFYGCEPESIAPKANFNPHTSAERSGDCSVDYIDENSGDVYAEFHDDSHFWGGQSGDANGKTLSGKVWNTLTTIEYEFVMTGYGNAYQAGDLQYYDKDLEEWVNLGSLTTGTPYGVSFPLAAGWSACDIISESFRQTGGGAPVELNPIEYALIAPSGCEDEFDAELVCDAGGNKTLTVTFTAENAGDYVIQGGLTNGTTIESMTADAGFTMNANHPGVVNSNANVTRWEGSLDECETVTIVIEFTGGNGVGSWSAKSEVNGQEVTNGYSADQDCL